MNKIIKEAPHISIDVNCPYDGVPIKVEDYRVELWDEPRDFKQYFALKLLQDDLIPVLCPNPKCPGRVFVYDKVAHEAYPRHPGKEVEDLLLKNDEYIYAVTGSLEYGEDNFWITPNGELKKVPSEWDHGDYINRYPKLFGLTKDMIDNYNTITNMDTASANGAVRIAIFANKAGIEGNKEALAKNYKRILELLKMYDVEQYWIEGEIKPRLMR